MVVYPIICKVLGPSQVVQDFFHQQYHPWDERYIYMNGWFVWSISRVNIPFVPPRGARGSTRLHRFGCNVFIYNLLVIFLNYSQGQRVSKHISKSFQIYIKQHLSIPKWNLNRTWKHIHNLGNELQNTWNESYPPLWHMKPAHCTNHIRIVSKADTGRGLP